MGLMDAFGAQDPMSAFFGGGTFGGPNESVQAKQLRDQADAYLATIMAVTDPRAQAAGYSLINPYTTPQAAQVNWKQAPITQMQAAQGQAMQGRASTAEGAAIDQSQQAQARAGQNALVASLQGTAAGVGPSAAQEQLRQTTAANIANQASAAQSAHGAARLAALRNATNNQANIQQTANSQAAALRANEIAGAQGMLGSALTSQRSQDVGLAGQAAQLAQQNAQFNAGNQQQMAMANLGFGNQFGLQNMAAQQGANQFNAGASNLAALNFAQQANAGNQALALANLNAQTQGNQLDLMRKQAYYDTIAQADKGRADILGSLYSGQLGYEDYLRKNNKGILGEGAGMMGSMGFGGGLGGLI